jgi:hypothetical protein
VAKKEKRKAVRNARRPQQVSFDYIKSNEFRVIHADGAHGGITPRGDAIQMAIYSERRPIPKRETYRLENGKLTDLQHVDLRDAFVREVEVELLLSTEVAKSLAAWLNEKVQAIESIQKKGDQSK